MQIMQLLKSDSGEYCCLSNLNLYDSSECQELATQVAAGRHVKSLSARSLNTAIEIYSCEDGYRAWLPISQLTQLKPATTVYQPVSISRAEIETRLSEIIAFTKAAMQQPNYYLWGGTVAPNYDCSGLIQAAFAASGIWLPRDSYQQADFTQKITQEEFLPGDLIFFAAKERVNHVALHLGDGYYIHSSGKEIGRNGIGIDRLSTTENDVSKAYYRQLWGMGRVMSSYQPMLGARD
ncbi:MAG: NlpC/P60 family protein [Xenococcaceae cyanobacterium]